MLATFILSTALFWACLHALIHLFGLQRTSNTPLPFAHSRRGGADLPAWTNRVKYDARTQITLKDVRLNISTGRLNDAHSSLASSLRHDPARNVVKAFYNLGAIIGATFTIISPVVLALIVVWMAAPLFQRNVAPAASPSHMKRSNVGETEPLATSQTRLQLLVRTIIRSTNQTEGRRRFQGSPPHYSTCPSQHSHFLCAWSCTKRVTRCVQLCKPLFVIYWRFSYN